jgi:hypothetical protein
MREATSILRSYVKKDMPHFIKNPAVKSRVSSVSKNPPAIGAGKTLGARTIFGAADEEEGFRLALVARSIV